MGQGQGQGREINRATQVADHQVTGREHMNHEEVLLMFESFFGGQAANVKSVLKKKLGSVQARVLLNQIFQAIYDNVQQMLVEHLLKSSALVGEVQTSSQIEDQESRVQSTENKQQIFQVFKTWKGIAGTDGAQMIKKAIESLFRVRDISTSNNEADYQVKMREIQTAFGILLESCGVMELTKNEIERHIIEMKLELEGSLKFSAVKNFELAKSLAGELLDTYITAGIQLAWKMVTQLPPMIAIEPRAFDPHTTKLEPCYAEEENASLQTITVGLRPILFFSYEGQVAVEGIVATLQQPSVNSETASQAQNLLNKPTNDLGVCSGEGQSTDTTHDPRPHLPFKVIDLKRAKTSLKSTAPQKRIGPDDSWLGKALKDAIVSRRKVIDSDEKEHEALEDEEEWNA